MSCIIKIIHIGQKVWLGDELLAQIAQIRKLGKRQAAATQFFVVTLQNLGGCWELNRVPQTAKTRKDRRCRLARELLVYDRAAQRL